MASEHDPVLQVLGEALRRRLGGAGGKGRIEYDTDLIETGILDSQALLDLVLEVEQRTERLFDAEAIDFEHGVTLRGIAAAFA